MLSSQVLVDSTPKKSNDSNQYLDISKLDKDYVRVYVIDRVFSNNYFAELDYGQNRKFKVKAYILTEDKSVRKFNSVTEIINLFSGNGWEYVNYESEVLTFKRKEN